MQQQYEIVKETPVAKFYYQGQSHTHPVRRTILVVEEHQDKLVGYELREGKEVRKGENAPIKTFRKDRIARYGDYSRLRMNRRNYARLATDSTLNRSDLLDLIATGA